ncbi:hypothetical protein B0H12DRAFT_218757 [Mycena haematopus]|nr:hypothetical protein B0H12DRAFT_218757 [Mycena haematopus]
MVPQIVAVEKRRRSNVEAEIRSLALRRVPGATRTTSARRRRRGSLIWRRIARCAKSKGLHSKGRRRDESDVLVALNSCRGKLANVAVDDDAGFMGHALRLPKDGDETMKTERGCEVIDPANKVYAPRRRNGRESAPRRPKRVVGDADIDVCVCRACVTYHPPGLYS